MRAGNVYQTDTLIQLQTSPGTVICVRVVMVSKALVVGAYQRKAEEIAALGVDLSVFTPPAWGDRRGTTTLEILHTSGYALRSLPVRLNNNFHLHHYPTLYRELTQIKPDLLHMDEEPYNFATWLALRAARRLRIPALFFTWQNINRRYPFPFSFFEQQNYCLATHAIAGNHDAAHVLKQKGYQKQISIIPQFGVDATDYAPRTTHPASTKLSTIAHTTTFAYAGGLLPEKGLDLLLHACAGLIGDWKLEIVGEGDQMDALGALAEKLGIGERVVFRGRLPSQQMAAFYREIDVFVLPSRTLPNWKEQFGRVLIEAMASEVVVIGSDSGEIPNVIGDAGLIFPEENAEALRSHMQQMIDQPAQRRKLAQLGRQRVLERFTMQQIAQQTVEVYESVMRGAL